MNDNPAQSPAGGQAAELPQAGGSYDVQPDGSLIQRECTSPATPELGPEPQPRD